MRKAGLVRFRQAKYGQNYDNNSQNDPKDLWVIPALLIATPFLAAMILNPFMWLMILLVWVAYKLIYGFKEE